MIAQFGKRSIAFLLAIIMVFSLVPVQAFAAETDEHDHDHDSEIVATPTETVPLETEHEHVFVAGEVIAPTCGALGHTVYACECGATENRDTVAATGEHVYVATIYEPTATEQGFTEHICTGCGDSYRIMRPPSPQWKANCCSSCGRTLLPL